MLSSDRSKISGTEAADQKMPTLVTKAGEEKNTLRSVDVSKFVPVTCCR